MGRKLAKGQTVGLLTLMYGDKKDSRKNYRVERISQTEGLVFQGDRPVAYFGCAQSVAAAKILPIKARMFLLWNNTLSLADATQAGKVHSSAEPVSRDVSIAKAQASAILEKLATLVVK